MSTGEWLDEVEERADLATRGPWWIADGEDDFRVEDDEGETIATLPVLGKAEQFLLSEPNAEFIAHAREDVPRLVGMLRRVLDRDGLMRVLNKAGAYCGMCSYEEGYGEDGCADCRRCLEAYAADLIAFIEGSEPDRV